MQTSKRIISILIPYKITDGNYYIYLQKRTDDAEILPSYIGFWGGGKENNETPEETLEREVKEELGIMIRDYKFFSKYEFYGSIKSIYYIEVDDLFDKQLVIGEGDYGKWFSETEIKNIDKFIDEDRLVADNFLRTFKKQNLWIKD